MTAATPGPSGPNLFSMFSGEGDGMYRARREAFAVSLLGQAVLVALLVYFLSIVIRGPNIGEALPRMQDLPLIYSGFTGGGGGNHDPLPASHGNPPRASLDPQLAPPTVIVPKEMPSLPCQKRSSWLRTLRYPRVAKSVIRCPSSRSRRTGRGARAVFRLAVVMA